MNTINRNIRGLCGALAVALGLGLAHPVGAEDQPEREWARQAGTPALDFATGVATDKHGNVYIAGTTGSAPDAPTVEVWLFKYSAAGALLWQQQFGTPTRDTVAGVAADKKGNIYIAGSADGSLAGANQGRTDAWIVKYSQHLNRSPKSD